jgi:hypothetical protein
MRTSFETDQIIYDAIREKKQMFVLTKKNVTLHNGLYSNYFIFICTLNCASEIRTNL